MAFSKEEQEIIRWGLDNKRPREEVEAAIARFRAGVQATPQENVVEEPQETTEVPLTERLGEVGGRRFSNIADAIEGEGEYAGRSSIRRGFEAAAQGASLPVEAVGQLLPQPVRSVLKGIGDFVGAGFKGLTDLIGSNKELQEWVLKNPDAAKVVEEIAGTGAAAGEIADDILTITPFSSRRVPNIAGIESNIDRANKITTDQLTNQKIKDATGPGGTKVLTAAEQQRLVDLPEFTVPTERATSMVVAPSPVEQVFSVGAKIASDAASSALDATRRSVGSLFSKPVRSIDEVIKQADDSPAMTRYRAETTAPTLTATEKWVGISPDIKRRIAGKQDKLQEYFDIAHGRNFDDTLPTPYEYGGLKAQAAVERMESLLNETGGKIGATRQKLGSYKATPEQVQKVETGFTSQLDKLNLEVRNGVIRQKPGTVSKAGTGDIKILNDFYNDLKVIKQSPSLINLIEFRSALDSRVNFAKRAAEASNEVDPFARQVRKDIADTAAQIVGKTEAAEVKRFSDFMDAYNDLKSYTDRRAGGEYLLRLVLSGRGGDARQIIQTIKEYTGTDLMDDATMMTIATDVIGNSRQQNLFRQEMTKAGLDAAALLTGHPSGAAGLLSNLITKHALNEEKIYLEAAK